MIVIMIYFQNVNNSGQVIFTKEHILLQSLLFNVVSKPAEQVILRE